MLTDDLIERFLSFVQIGEAEACWPWRGYVRSTGYGNFTVARKNHLAHRVAYEHFVGEIPAGLQIDHLCRNRVCVNPAHLEVVTQRENMRRSGVLDYQRQKTHCNRGHEFTPENTHIGTNGFRNCCTCRRIHQATYRAARKREAVATNGERG